MKEVALPSFFTENITFFKKQTFDNLCYSYVADLTDFEGDLGTYNSLFKENLTENELAKYILKNGVNGLLEMNLQDSDYEDLPIAERLGITGGKKRIMNIFDFDYKKNKNKSKHKLVAFDNDYVLLLDSNNKNEQYLDLPKMSREEAISLNETQKNAYFVIPRIIAENFNYKKIADKLNLIQDKQPTEKKPHEMTFEEWEKNVFWSGNRHLAGVKRKKDNFVLRVFSKDNELLAEYFFDKKDIEIEKVNTVSLNSYYNFTYFKELLYKREKRNYHIRALKVLRFDEPTSDKFRLVPTENGYKAVRGLGSVVKDSEYYFGYKSELALMSWEDFMVNTVIKFKGNSKNPKLFAELFIINGINNKEHKEMYKNHAIFTYHADHLPKIQNINGKIFIETSLIGNKGTYELDSSKGNVPEDVIWRSQQIFKRTAFEVIKSEFTFKLQKNLQKLRF